MTVLTPIPWINEFKSFHGDGMADQLMEEMYRPAKNISSMDLLCVGVYAV
jgi:hypothetical protein